MERSQVSVFEGNDELPIVFGANIKYGIIGIKAVSQDTYRKPGEVFLDFFSYTLESLLLAVLFFVITVRVVFDKF